MTVLLVPSIERLPAYAEALARGWSPDNVRGQLVAEEELVLIDRDPEAFVAALDDPDALGGPITLADGTRVPRLPGFRRWIWDEGFAGSIGFRWRPGTSTLPDYMPYGHIGYAVPEWRRGRGYATRGLALMLPLARARGLDWVELTTEADNPASQRVIVKNGGHVTARFRDPRFHGDGEILRWRIDLTGVSPPTG